MTLSIDRAPSAGANLPALTPSAAAAARDLAGRAGLTRLSSVAGLDFRFAEDFNYRRQAGSNGIEQLSPRIDLLTEIARTGRAFIPNWSFISGDKVGPLREVAENGIRYNQPAERHQGGALVETAAATNKIRNPRCLGAKIGEVTNSGPGELPDNWQLYATGGQVFVTAVGAVDNWDFVEVRFAGTFTGDNWIEFEALNYLAINPGVWSVMSVGLQHVAGTLPSTLRAGMWGRNSGGSLITTNYSDYMHNTADPADHRRYWAPQVADANAATHHALLYGANFGGGAVDFTIRIFWPQYETDILEPSSPIGPAIGEQGEATRGAEGYLGGFSGFRSSGACAFDWDWTHGGVCGPIRHFGDNVPRIGEWGLRTERGVTNFCPNPRFIGATIGTLGSGGVLPTGWSWAASGGMSCSVVAVGEDDFGEYIDIRHHGTATGDMRMDFNLPTHVSALAGETWCVSFFARLIAGELSSGQLQASLTGLTSAGSSAFSSRQNVTLDALPRRWFAPDTLANTSGTVANVSGGYYLDNPSGAVDFTMRIYATQLEGQLHPSSPVYPAPGTTGNSTRAEEWHFYDLRGELPDQTNLGVTAALYAELCFGVLPTTAGYNASTPFFVTLRNALNTNYYMALYQSGGALVPFVVNHGSGVGFGGSTYVAARGDIMRMSLGVAQNDLVSSAEGIAQQTDNTGEISAIVDRLEFGSIAGGSDQQCDLKEVRVFPSRLLDADHEALCNNA